MASSWFPVFCVPLHSTVKVHFKMEFRPMTFPSNNCERLFHHKESGIDLVPHALHPSDLTSYENVPLTQVTQQKWPPCCSSHRGALDMFPLQCVWNVPPDTCALDPWLSFGVHWKAIKSVDIPSKGTLSKTSKLYPIKTKKLIRCFLAPFPALLFLFINILYSLSLLLSPALPRI